MKFASGAAGIPYWQELDRFTATGTIDTLDVSSLPAKPYYMILGHIIPDSTVSDKLQYNGVTGSDYASTGQGNGGGEGSNAPNPNITLNYTSDSNTRMYVGMIESFTDYEKLGMFWTNQASGTADSDVPNRSEMAGKWADTSSQINQITDNNDKAGSYNTGSELVVLGYDPDNDDTDDSNFWELLGSDTGGSSVLSSGTIESKRYLLVYFGQSSNVQGRIRVNDDSTAAYSLRRNEDGTERTEASQNEWRSWNNGSAVSRFITMFIVNKSDQTKLMYYWNMESSAAGNNNINAMQAAGMWDNASDAITKIEFDSDNVANPFDSKAYLQVYGAN